MDAQISSLARLNLGITAAPRQPQFSNQWQILFHSLPTELHQNIMAHLEPPSQMCLGLTSQYFHNIFHFIYGGGETFRVKRYPFDLRMTESVCGKYMMFWWWDHWFLEDSDDIIWERNLGELLRGERLWGELRCCEECWTYKPKTAFDEKCEFEMEALEGKKDLLETLITEDIEWLRGGCRRCRVRKILVCLEGREEVFENGRTNEWTEWEMGKSLGLKRLRMTDDADFAHIEKKTVLDERHDLDGGYESWESIYAGFGI